MTFQAMHGLLVYPQVGRKVIGSRVIGYRLSRCENCGSMSLVNVREND